MAEEGGDKKPQILIARPGMGISEMKTGQPTVPERTSVLIRQDVRSQSLLKLDRLVSMDDTARELHANINERVNQKDQEGNLTTSLFEEIQSRLSGQSPEVAGVLKEARSELVKAARKDGVFDEIERQIEKALEAEDFLKAKEAIRKLDTAELDDKEDASLDYRGMVASYKQSVLDRMSFAEYSAGIEKAEDLGYAEDRIDELETQKAEVEERITFLAIDKPRSEITTKASNYFEKLVEKKKAREAEIEAERKKQEDRDKQEELLRAQKEVAEAMKKAAEGIAGGGAGGTGGATEDLRQAAEALREATRRIGEMEGFIRRYETLVNNLNRIADATERRNAMQDAMDREEVEYRRLMMTGYDTFILGEESRIIYSPENFKAYEPIWYKRMGDTERRIVSQRVEINYLAAVLRLHGMTDLDTVLNAKAEIRRYNLDDMLEYMPGFKQAMATIVENMFEHKEDQAGHHIEHHFVFSAKGYEIIEDETSLREYQTSLEAKINTYLERRRDIKTLKERWGDVDSKYLAKAAVNSVMNLFYATGVFDSASETRKLWSDRIYSEQVRSFFLPGIKAIQKWTSKYEYELGSGGEGTEEGWGGVLGEWIVDGITHDPDYEERFKSGEIKYIPRRMIYSMFDHSEVRLYMDPSLSDKTRTRKDQRYLRTPEEEQMDANRKSETDEDKKEKYKITLAQYLLRMKKKSTGVPGLYDFEDVVDFTKIAEDDLYNAYADTRDAVVQMYRHITRKEDDKPPSLVKFLEARNKARKDRMLRPLYGGKGAEDFMTVAMGLVLSPSGFKEGSTEIILKIDPRQDYNTVVGDLIYKLQRRVGKRIVKEEEKLKEVPVGGMPEGFLRRLRESLGSGDTTSFKDELIETYFPFLTSRRKREREMERRRSRRIKD